MSKQFQKKIRYKLIFLLPNMAKQSSKELATRECLISPIIDIFKDEIIPLLMEYFYGDYSKIGMVLGAPFIQLKNNHNNKAAQTHSTKRSKCFSCMFVPPFIIQ